jgi:hypothetical protein
MEARQSQFNIKNAKSVKEVGYHEDKNFPARQNMEDCMPDFTKITFVLMTSMGTARDYSASSMVMEEPKYPNTVPM